MKTEGIKTHSHVRVLEKQDTVKWLDCLSKLQRRDCVPRFGDRLLRSRKPLQLFYIWLAALRIPSLLAGAEAPVKLEQSTAANEFKNMKETRENACFRRFVFQTIDITKGNF